MRGFAGRTPLLAVTILTACAPTVVTIDPAAPIGPQLVVDVVNGSDRERSIGYQFEHVASSGGGEGTVSACERVAVPFGEIGGSYTIQLDGEALTEGAVPSGVSAEGFMVLRVVIGADGEADVTGPAIVAVMPVLNPTPVAGCG